MMEFKSTKISQLEAEFLLEIEDLTKNEFYNRSRDRFSFSDLSFVAENNHITELRIFNCGLSILPKSIGYLSSLKKLNLGSNKLEELPESIGELRSLEKLILIGNPLKILPESIGNLTSLDDLDLDWVKISHIPKSVGNLKVPERLYLPDKNIQTLPESIGNLLSLNRIFISHNNLKSLPKSIGKLTSLRNLVLGSNPFLTFPEPILQLKSLEVLDLSNCKLDYLPESIDSLKSLKRIWLSDNELTNLPSSIGNLTSLEQLHLEGNQLTTIPDSIGNLTSLNTLVLSKNRLITLPESIGNLRSLKGLYLENNKLTSLPESLGHLRSLNTLDLVSNPLKTLPESIEDLTSTILYPSLREDILRMLELSNLNEIKEFLDTAELQYLGKEGLISLFNRIKAMDVEIHEEGDRFVVLDKLMYELQFNYGVEFSLSEIANSRLYENESNAFVEITSNSPYPYEEDHFDDDTVRRRYWDKRLFYDIYRGHVDSIELFCDSSTIELFQNNLKKLDNLPHLETLNLVFFCRYQYKSVKQILRNFKLLKYIKVYEFFRPNWHHSYEIVWRYGGRNY